jgi:hypothetical protein
MAKTQADLRSLCRAFTTEMVQVVAGIARASETPPGVRVQAAALLWDRGWGRAPQTHTGADGEGDIRVTIRHIIEGGGRASDAPSAKAELIEHAPMRLVEDDR